MNKGWNRIENIANRHDAEPGDFILYASKFCGESDRMLANDRCEPAAGEILDTG
jgi:hypothetical protein